MRTRATLLLPLLLLAGCSSSYSYTRFQSGKVVVEQHDDGPAAVAWYHDGEILGAEAVLDDDFPLRDWVKGEAIDHPDIPRWRQQVAELRALAAAPDTRGRQLARAAAGLPFDDVVGEQCAAWVGDRPERAAELLDCAADLDIRHAFAEQLAATALRGDAGDDRVAQWVRALTHADHDQAVLALVTGTAPAPRTAEAALTRLDDYAGRNRRAIFDAAAPVLAADAASAWQVVEAAEALPSADEGEALVSLLEGAPPELARQVLRRLGDRPTSQRTRLFARAAERACLDANSHSAIAQALAELPTGQRLDAARGVVERPDAAAGLVVVLVDAVDALRSSDREEFLLGVLAGPHGADPAVRDACADAARRHLPARARERVFGRLGRQR